MLCQVVACGVGRGFGPVVCGCLVEDIVNVVAHSPYADEQLFGDLSISLSSSDEA